MPSPFPGMDPWLESSWSDVHNRLCTYASDSLNTKLGRNYQATVDHRIVLGDGGEGTRAVRPDVRVVRRPGSNGSPGGGGVAVAAETGLKSLVISLADAVDAEELKQAFVEVRDRGGRLLTVIEFVSPANKGGGDGGEKYREKQEECVASGVGLVEIDLTRGGGRRRLLAHRGPVPRAAQAADYFISVWRPWKPAEAQAWPVSLRSPLPEIPVPLREGEPEPVLPLQELIDEAYDRGNYTYFAAYDADPIPPLKQADRAWARPIIESFQASL